jgi:hypothetical protein
VNRIESVGIVRSQRFAPMATTSFFSIRGRESLTQIRYDYDQRIVHYYHTSETFFLGRRRVAEDAIGIPADQPLDDIVTATLNYAEGVVERDGQRAYRTFVVRRARPEQEGPDDVQAAGYKAEIVPFRFTVTQDGEGGRPLCLLDLTRFSSWARAGQPARVSFGPDRRPESIHAPLMLGTTVQIRFQPTS